MKIKLILLSFIIMGCTNNELYKYHQMAKIKELKCYYINKGDSLIDGHYCIQFKGNLK